LQCRSRCFFFFDLSAIVKGVQDGGGWFLAFMSLGYLVVPFALAFAVNWLVLKLMRLPRPAPDPAETFE
jgi:hypothetical protein